MFATRRLRPIALVLALVLFVAVSAQAAAAKGPAVRVSGGGHGLLTASTDPANDPQGLVETKEFPIQFSFAGTIAEDGTTHGHINFVFTGEFARTWGAPDESGAVPADHVHIIGKVTDSEVQADGTITLSGWLTESDFDRGDGKYFTVDDPFTITVGGPALGADEFILQWCLLPSFPVRVTSGNLQVR